MKVAMIIDAWEPIVGGGQVHVYNLCRNLIENHDCSIDLFVRSLKNEDGSLFNKDEVLLGGKLRILRCGKPRYFFDLFGRIMSIFSIFFRILNENKKEKYDLIHAHVYLGAFSGKMASIYLSIPIILTCHGTQLLDKGIKNMEYFVEKIILTKIRYHALITVGRGLFKYKNINKNIVLIGNGVDKKYLDQETIPKNENIYRILFVGRLDEFKGVDTLIESIRNTRDDFKRKVEVHLIGYGYDEEYYKNMVSKYSLNDIIKFRGKIMGNELLNEYRLSDVFVLPSKSEGFGIVILEAMALGIPVISTKSGGPEDIIQDGINGFLIEKNNTEQLSRIIRKFVGGEVDNLNDVVLNAKKTVLEKYTWSHISNLVFNEYNKVGK